MDFYIETIINILNETTQTNLKSDLNNLFGHPSTLDELVNTFKSFGDSQKKSIIAKIKSVQRQPNTLIYHASPSQNAENIQKDGLKLTKGLRSGVFGDTKTVDNLGIFLSEDEELAKAFAENKIEKGFQYPVVFAFELLTYNLLDMTDWKNVPKKIKDFCLKKITEYEGEVVKKPSGEDYFWFLDQKEIVDLIKQEGFHGVKFPESPTTRKMLGRYKESNQNSYMIFDPKHLRLYRNLLKMNDLFNFLQS